MEGNTEGEKGTTGNGVYAHTCLPNLATVLMRPNPSTVQLPAPSHRAVCVHPARSSAARACEGATDMPPPASQCAYTSRAGWVGTSRDSPSHGTSGRSGTAGTTAQVSRRRGDADGSRLRGRQCLKGHTRLRDWGPCVGPMFTCLRHFQLLVPAVASPLRTGPVWGKGVSGIRQPSRNSTL